jgi:hypothetical protein
MPGSIYQKDVFLNQKNQGAEGPAPESEEVNQLNAYGT